MAHRLAQWVDFSRRKSGFVIAACLTITLLAAVYALLFLGINSDNVRLVSDDLPSRKNHDAFAEIFPNLDNALMVVIDGETPEVARQSANRLLEVLQKDSAYVEKAYLPGGGDFFEKHGMLYRSPDDLEIFADQIIRLQPLLASLEADPSIVHLTSLVEAGLDQARNGNGNAAIDPEEWAAILDSVGEATVSVYTEFPLALSWEKLLLQGSALDASSRQLIVVHPVLNFESFLAGGEILERIRSYARQLELTPDKGVRVRVTGNPALNYEEMIGLGWDLGLGGGRLLFLRCRDSFKSSSVYQARRRSRRDSSHGPNLECRLCGRRRGTLKPRQRLLRHSLYWARRRLRDSSWNGLRGPNAKGKKQSRGSRWRHPSSGWITAHLHRDHSHWIFRLRSHRLPRRCRTRPYCGRRNVHHPHSDTHPYASVAHTLVTDQSRGRTHT